MWRCTGQGKLYATGRSRARVYQDHLPSFDQAAVSGVKRAKRPRESTENFMIACRLRTDARELCCYLEERCRHAIRSPQCQVETEASCQLRCLSSSEGHNAVVLIWRKACSERTVELETAGSNLAQWRVRPWVRRFLGDYRGRGRRKKKMPGVAPGTFLA